MVPMKNRKVKTISISSLGLMVLTMVLSCQKQVDKFNETDWSNNNLKGKVKQLDKVKYKARDSFGIILKGEVLGSDDNWWNRPETCIYSEEGRLAKKYTYDNHLTPLDTANYYYDNEDRLTKRELFVSNHIIVINKIKYDGKTEINTAYNKNGNISGKFISEFDGQQNLIKESSYDSVGNLSSVYICSNFIGYNKPKSLEYKRGNSVDEVTYDYDKDERIIFDSSTSFNPEGDIESKHSKRYVYNHQGFDSIIWVYSEYDWRNNPTKEKIEYRYKYDKFFNWIERVKFVNGFAKEIKPHRLEYYD